MPKKPKLIQIFWSDATANARWMTLDEAIEWGKTSTWDVEEVGWVLDETDEYILLASRRMLQEDSSYTYGAFQKIPRTWIRSRKVLRT